VRRLLACLVLCFATEALAEAPPNGSTGGSFGYTVMGQTKPVPNNGRPAVHVPFPDIKDWASLKITLTRGMCFGTCPVYTLEIDGDGSVHYKGERFVAISGKHRTYIAPNAVRDLYVQFQKADFFWLLEGYQADVTDNPAYSLTLAYDGKSKTVGDYVGLMAGMPKAVAALENAVDVTAHAKTWVSGDADTIAALRAEGWNFKSRAESNLRLLSDAEAARDNPFLTTLLDAGVPADTHYGCEAMEHAAYDDPKLVKKLIDAGAPVHWEPPSGNSGEVCDVLIIAAQSGVPEIVRLVLSKHPDPNWHDGQGLTALMALGGNGWLNPKRHDQDYPQSATLLLAGGADPFLKNASGRTALDMRADLLDSDGVARVLRNWMASHPKP
jgi:hypothetical protein